MEKVIKFRKCGNRQIFHGDNLQVLETLEPEQIHFIYIDPPYNADSVFKSKAWGKEVGFIDKRDADEYANWLEKRLKAMKKVLKPNGVIAVQLDTHSVHRIKLIMDEIFGASNFINQITWDRFSGQKNNLKNRFANDSDFILIYAKGKGWTFNELKKLELDPKNIRERYKHQLIKGKIVKLTKEQLDGKKLIAGERIRLNYRSKNNKQKGGCEYSFLKNSKGKLFNNIWTDIPECSSSTKETTGYPTQKPEPLLERLIRTFTKEGDTIADFFCGCGTTISVAEGLKDLKLNWIGLDIYRGAIEVMQKRLERDHKVKVKIIDTLCNTIEELNNLEWLEYQIRTIELLGGRPNFNPGKDGGCDGFKNQAPMQVKCYNKALGSKELELKFIKEVKKTKAKIGYFISKKGFTADFKKTVKDLKKENITLYLFDTEDVLNYFHRKVA